MIPACIIKDYQALPKVKLEQAIENLTKNSAADCVTRPGMDSEMLAMIAERRRMYDEMLVCMKQILATKS